MKTKFYCILLLLLGLNANGYSQNAVVPANIIVTPSFEHISIHYNINGDLNLNSDLTLSFKPKNASSYEAGAKSMRAYPSLIIDGSALNMNFHAASAMFLEAGVEYDLKLDLVDQDGGSTSSVISVSTKAYPKNATTIKYVSPGTGGGNGSLANPYLGLQAAADNANAGDHFMVSPGTYDAFSINSSGTNTNPISFESEILHGAIVDGNNTNTGIITVGVYNDSIAHVLFDGFKIQDGRWGIDAQNTIHFTVKNCWLTDVDYGIVNRRANGWEHDQYFYNNTIEGNTSWPQSGIPGERGIDIRGNNNVVSFNTIQDFGDGISTDGPPYLSSYGLDIHNNDIKNIVDDIIEIDGTISNTRVYNNRAYNGRMGVSIAPIFGGPCYIFRNEFFNLELSAFKLNRGPSGIILAHNTAVKLTNGMSSNAGWQNTYLRNNVIVASRYCFEEYGLVPGSTDDWNYNAYLSTRAGNPGAEWFKWDNIRYNDVPTLQASGLIENNAVATSFSDFVNISLPTAYSISYDPTQRDFTPTINAVVIDAGEALDNLNTAYVGDDNPDMGAIEFGQSAIPYGANYTPPSCNDGLKNGDESYIDCGGSCTACDDCPYATITLSEIPITDDLNLHTSDWIRSDGIVPFNGILSFKAENEIELLPGFETVLGADLLIEISNCN